SQGRVEHGRRSTRIRKRTGAEYRRIHQWSGQRPTYGNRSHVWTFGEACRTAMNTRNIIRLVVGAAALSTVAATVFTAQGQRGNAPPPGQIAIPQPCTPELIAAEDAAAAQPAGRGGRGVPCHRPDPRENLKPGLYDAGEAAKGLRLATTLHQPEGMFDPNP